MSRKITGIFFILITFLSFFGCHKEKARIARSDLYKATYLEEWEKLQNDFRKQGYTLDDTLNYSPGYVEKIDTDDIVVDPLTGTDIINGEFIIETHPGIDAETLLKELKRNKIESALVGCVPTFNFYQVRVNDFSDETFEKLKSLECVNNVFYHFVESVEEVEARETSLWHLSRYNIPLIWDIADGSDVCVAVIDTGMEMDTTVFQDRIAFPYSVVTRSAVFEDEVIFKNNNSTRVISHGTQVASIIAANYQEKGYNGIAPGARIMPIQVLGYSLWHDRIVTNDLSVIEGIARAIAFEADIINLSLGTDYTDLMSQLSEDPSIRDTVYQSMTAHVTRVLPLFEQPLAECRKRDIAVVCSAGNDGIPASLNPLSASPLTITVGAIDQDNITAHFSNTGEAVDCYAPGVEILAVSPGGSLFKVSGTSFSSPYVAGIIALVMSAGYRFPAAEYKSKLEITNFESRASLFPEDSIMIFNPLLYVNSFVAEFSKSKTYLEQYDFFNRFHDLYIQKEDNAITIYNKILKYYQRRELFFSEDIEAQWAIKNAGRYFNHLYKLITDNSSYAYYAALILREADLSSAQLDQIKQNIMVSDYFSLICNNHCGAEVLPDYYKRIKMKRNDFNANTLFGIQKFADRATAEQVSRDYLIYLQGNSKRFTDDEDIACYVLAKSLTTKSKDSIDLILTSYKRLHSYSYSNVYYMILALITVGQKQGIELIIDCLEYYDRREYDNIGEFEMLQKLLNTRTRFGIRYSYLDPPEKKAETLRLFRKKLKQSEFKRGIFYSD